MAFFLLCDGDDGGGCMMMVLVSAVAAVFGCRSSHISRYSSPKRYFNNHEDKTCKVSFSLASVRIDVTALFL